MAEEKRISFYIDEDIRVDLIGKVKSISDAGIWLRLEVGKIEVYNQAAIKRVP